MPDFKAKVHKIWFPLGELTALPWPPTYIRGGLLLRKLKSDLASSSGMTLGDREGHFSRRPSLSPKVIRSKKECSHADDVWLPISLPLLLCLQVSPFVFEMARYLGGKLQQNSYSMCRAYCAPLTECSVWTFTVTGEMCQIQCMHYSNDERNRL